MSTPHLQSLSVDQNRQQELQQILDALRGLKFGVVNIIVQDGVVVQIDRTEKRRLAQTKSRNASARTSGHPNDS